MTFASFKNARIVRSSWLDEGGRRLDCNPYMSGALEARETLRQLAWRKDSLRLVTIAMFDSGRESRNWVDAPELGIRYMGSSAINLADLSYLPLISKKQVERNPRLLVEKDWSLITRSGTVGRMAYVRSDMAGLACSEDVLRVVPNPEVISPGYLYAFLSSRYGVPLVVSGTYGAIIQHIEPEHIADLPVPRFDGDFENQIDKLVSGAANNISESSRLTSLATQTLLQAIGRSDLRDDMWHLDTRAGGWKENSVTSESLRALNYDPRIAEIRREIEAGPHSQLGTLCDPAQFKGKIIFTRIDADPEHGYMLLGQRNAFHLRPEGRWISRKSVAGLGLIVPPGTTLIPSHGTLGEFELYCRALIVTRRTSQYAYSGDFFRCVPIKGSIEPGYLFAFMRSRLAFRMLRSISIGGKQQEQHPAMMYRLPIPRLDRTKEREIAALIDKANNLYDQGLNAEDQARSLIEEKIRNGGI
ncbi:methylation-associated defense system restriction endonuclease subunit S MAD5 [Burkholderia ambifaria]|uniref:methylation-associated defense system restriction endonuclease subunit S MAD5 n=1 Tax=Burkholderia ambifaria TaxID=152480 RepID=UPI001589260F|nr:restriction endonuclease subunit S [Burkholderia ambifaria]